MAIVTTTIGLTEKQQEVAELLQSLGSLDSVLRSMLENMANTYWGGEKEDIEARHALIDPADNTKLLALFSSMVAVLEQAEPGSTADLVAIVTEGQTKLAS